MHIEDGGELTTPPTNTLCRSRTPPGPLAGCGEVGRAAEFSPCPPNPLCNLTGGPFHFTPGYVPAALPGLKRFYSKELFPGVGTLVWEFLAFSIKSCVSFLSGRLLVIPFMLAGGAAGFDSW